MALVSSYYRSTSSRCGELVPLGLSVWLPSLSSSSGRWVALQPDPVHRSWVGSWGESVNFRRSNGRTRALGWLLMCPAHSLSRLLYVHGPTSPSLALPAGQVSLLLPRALFPVQGPGLAFVSTAFPRDLVPLTGAGTVYGLLGVEFEINTSLLRWSLTPAFLFPPLRGRGYHSHFKRSRVL